MTDRRPNVYSVPFNLGARRSPFSARKVALMASVVVGLGVVVYGFDFFARSF